jgi:hypothetical protein
LKKRTEDTGQRIHCLPALKIKLRRPVVLIVHAFDPDAAAVADPDVLIAFVVPAP